MFMVLFFLLLLVTNSYAFLYSVTQITSNSYYESNVKINDSGNAVWTGSPVLQPQVYLLDGSQITQLTYDDNTWNTGACISGNGHIAWVWENPYTNPGKRKIKYYNGSTTSVIADPNNLVSSPSITDETIIWMGRIGPSSSGNSINEIWLYNGSTTTRLTENSYSDSNPTINLNGQAAWVGSVPFASSEIFYFDGSSTIRLSNNQLIDDSVQINDTGYVVWQRQNISNYTSNYNIYLYDGITTKRISTLVGDDKFPQINSDGNVVWQGHDGSDNEIFLYDGNTVTQLTDNSYDDACPNINDRGYVVWKGYDGNDYEIFFYDGSTTVQISDNDFDDAVGNLPVEINNNGDIYWSANGEIFKATSPPSAISNTPTDNAIDISVDSVITATFSEGMTPSSIDTNSFTVNNGVLGTVSYDSNTTTATFTPTVDLNFDTTYTVRITTDAEDSTGNQMQADFTWSFTTGSPPDDTPPTVDSNSPLNGAINIPIDSAMSVTFSEDMDPLTIDTNTFTLDNGVTGSINYDLATKTATFTPTTDLDYSTIYTATVTSGVKDLALNPLQTNHTWSFTTLPDPDTTPPVVDSTSPDDNETDVPVDSEILVTFSENMDATSIDSNTLYLDNAATCSVSYDVGTKTAALTPLADLNEDTTYTVTVTTGAKDMAGNALQADSTYSFTTNSATAGNGDSGGSGGSGRSGGGFINTMMK
jgi:hypothetical protein